MSQGRCVDLIAVGGVGEPVTLMTAKPIIKHELADMVGPSVWTFKETTTRSLNDVEGPVGLVFSVELELAIDLVLRKRDVVRRVMTD